MRPRRTESLARPWGPRSPFPGDAGAVPTRFPALPARRSVRDVRTDRRVLTDPVDCPVHSGDVTPARVRRMNS
ncbi:hypothetical protein GCM10010300_53800 [Streptomyces olivaceoviridis]|nr:hypothetical protein GCM10010300_53800 [Streptomyces olivaceoviridis]